MTEQPPTGWSGFTAGLPVEPAPEPPSTASTPAPEPPAPEPPQMPDAHQGARAPMPPDEDAQLAAAWRRMSGLPLAG